MRTLQEFRFQVRVRRCSVYSRRPHLCRYHGWAKCKQWYLLVVLNLNFCPGCWFTCGRYLRAYFLWDTCWSVTPKGEEKPFANIAFKTASHNAESIQQHRPHSTQRTTFSRQATFYIFEDIGAVLQQKDEARRWDTCQGLREWIWTGSMTASTWTQRLRSITSTQPNNWQTYWQNGLSQENAGHNFWHCSMWCHTASSLKVLWLPLQFLVFVRHVK